MSAFLPHWVKPGVRFRLNLGEDNPNTRVFHVRALVDDQVVLRYWSKPHRNWRYSIADQIWFSINAEYIDLIKPKGE